MYTRGETSIGRRTVESIKTKSHVPRKHVRRSRGVRFRFDRGSATTSRHTNARSGKSNRSRHERIEILFPIDDGESEILFDREWVCLCLEGRGSWVDQKIKIFWREVLMYERWSLTGGRGGGALVPALWSRRIPQETFVTLYHSLYFRVNFNCEWNEIFPSSAAFRKKCFVERILNVRIVKCIIFP